MFASAVKQHNELSSQLCRQKLFKTHLRAVNCSQGNPLQVANRVQKPCNSRIPRCFSVSNGEKVCSSMWFIAKASVCARDFCITHLLYRHRVQAPGDAQNHSGTDWLPPEYFYSLSPFSRVTDGCSAFYRSGATGNVLTDSTSSDQELFSPF